MLTRHIREFLQVTPGPFPIFWVGPRDEARVIDGLNGWGIYDLNWWPGQLEGRWVGHL